MWVEMEDRIYFDPNPHTKQEKVLLHGLNLSNVQTLHIVKCHVRVLSQINTTLMYVLEGFVPLMGIDCFDRGSSVCDLLGAQDICHLTVNSL